MDGQAVAARIYTPSPVPNPVTKVVDARAPTEMQAVSREADGSGDQTGDDRLKAALVGAIQAVVSTTDDGAVKSALRCFVGTPERLLDGRRDDWRAAVDSAAHEDCGLIQAVLESAMTDDGDVEPGPILVKCSGALAEAVYEILLAEGGDQPQADPSWPPLVAAVMLIVSASWMSAGLFDAGLPTGSWLANRASAECQWLGLALGLLAVPYLRTLKVATWRGASMVALGGYLASASLFSYWARDAALLKLAGSAFLLGVVIGDMCDLIRHHGRRYVDRALAATIGLAWLGTRFHPTVGGGAVYAIELAAMAGAVIALARIAPRKYDGDRDRGTVATFHHIASHGPARRRWLDLAMLYAVTTAAVFLVSAATRFAYWPFWLRDSGLGLAAGALGLAATGANRPTKEVPWRRFALAVLGSGALVALVALAWRSGVRALALFIPFALVVKGVLAAVTVVFANRHSRRTSFASALAVFYLASFSQLAAAWLARAFIARIWGW
jgi:hypothetical protein